MPNSFFFEFEILIRKNKNLLFRNNKHYVFVFVLLTNHLMLLFNENVVSLCDIIKTKKKLVFTK